MKIRDNNIISYLSVKNYNFNAMNIIYIKTGPRGRQPAARVAIFIARIKMVNFHVLFLFHDIIKFV